RYPFDHREWLLPYDTVPPLITGYRVVVLGDRSLAIQIQGDDQHSAMAARGVWTHFSIDGGHSWQRALHHHKINQEGRATTFETVIGPFPDGATILMRMQAVDVAGNAQAEILLGSVAALMVPGRSHLAFAPALLLPSVGSHWLFDLGDRVRNDGEPERT